MTEKQIEVVEMTEDELDGVEGASWGMAPIGSKNRALRPVEHDGIITCDTSTTA